MQPAEGQASTILPKPAERPLACCLARDSENAISLPSSILRKYEAQKDTFAN
jgi:hypothetical protein